MGLFSRKPKPETKFEKIWVSENVSNEYGASKVLSDIEYIEYYIWGLENAQEMYDKYCPKSKVISSDYTNIIFHGGCVGCKSQMLFGINRCRGCKFFKSDWSKPNLEIKGKVIVETPDGEMKLKTNESIL